MLLKIAAFFLLFSGIASLTYQVAWVRLLGLSMGSTSASISTVLAAFFLGLALGSYLAERITRNRINSLKIYIYLEIVIGLSGLILLPILLNLDSLVANFPVLGSALTAKFFIAVFLLTIPTLCMGATFPVMASILIRQRSEVGVRMSQLYSLNTAGAVLGAAMAGFVFIPNWGLDGAIYIAFSINLLIVVSGLYLNAYITLPPIETEPVAQIDRSRKDSIAEEAPLRGRALLVLFATGLVSIATEVGWTKYLSIFTGTTIYGFASILTIFLIGIASGSWVIKNHIERMRRPEMWMAFGLVLLGTSLLMTRAGLSLIPPVYEAINHLPGYTSVRHGVKYLFVFILLFPPTFILGALFPINLRLYCGNLQGVRSRIGKAYAVNTVASIFGSIIAGFWIIPEFGTDVLLTAMAFVILILPFIFVPALHAPGPRVAITGVALIALLSNWVLPHISYKDLIASVQYVYDKEAYGNKDPEFLFLKEGKAGVISMVTYDKRHVRLQNNGLNESFIDLENDRNVLLVETLLALVPYMIHEDPKKAFVVGFGGGITTRAMVSTSLESIKVVELEPAVIEAGRAILHGEIPALTDPRVTLEFNDARNTLLIEDAKYDIISAQPSHPWLARASNVFTKEFFTIVKSRLNEGGIYGQWVNLFNMDATTLRSIFKAFYEVFPQGITFANLPSGDFLLFGSEKPIVFNYDQVGKRMSEPKIKNVLDWHGIREPRDLFWYFALSRDEAMKAAGDVEPNTDTNILSEVRLSALDRNGVGKEDPYNFLKENYSIDLIPYLNVDVSNKMLRLADYFYTWDKPEYAVKIARQLKTLDPVISRTIIYENKMRSAKYDEALKYFTEHEEWSDRTRSQHTQILAELKRFDEAMTNALKIQNQSTRQATIGRLLYMQDKLSELALTQAETKEGQKWQAVGLAQRSIVKAGKLLSELESDKSVSLDIPQLRVMVRYYGHINEAQKLEAYSRRLVAAIDKEVSRLAGLTTRAIKDEVKLRAERLLGQIEVLNPDFKKLETMRKKIDKLKPA